MSYTKKEICLASLQMCGLGSSVYDFDDNRLSSSVAKLDAMMAELQNLNVNIPYPIEADPDSTNLGTDSNIPSIYNETIISMLAIRLAPLFGRTVSRDVKMVAAAGKRQMLNQALNDNPQERKNTPDMPTGSGNKPWKYSSNNFYDKPQDNPLSNIGI